MHPYISRAIAAERAADAVRTADASRRAQDFQEEAAAVGASTHHCLQAHRSHQSYRAQRAARRRPNCAGLTVETASTARAIHR
jgi:hypothetical protein